MGVMDFIIEFIFFANKFQNDMMRRVRNDFLGQIAIHPSGPFISRRATAHPNAAWEREEQSSPPHWDISVIDRQI